MGFYRHGCLQILRSWAISWIEGKFPSERSLVIRKRNSSNSSKQDLLKGHNSPFHRHLRKERPRGMGVGNPHQGCFLCFSGAVWPLIATGFVFRSLPRAFLGEILSFCFFVALTGCTSPVSQCSAIPFLFNSAHHSPLQSHCLHPKFLRENPVVLMWISYVSLI